VVLTKIDCGIQADKGLPSITNQMSQILPILTMVVTFAVYTGVQKKELTASTGKLIRAVRADLQSSPV
jgi:hypothetical protein